MCFLVGKSGSENCFGHAMHFVNYIEQYEQKEMQLNIFIDLISRQTTSNTHEYTLYHTTFWWHMQLECYSHIFQSSALLCSWFVYGWLNLCALALSTFYEFLLYNEVIKMKAEISIKCKIAIKFMRCSFVLNNRFFLQYLR